MSNPLLYTLRTRTNLHAGAGDRSFGIIDKHVQRDATTGLPVVYGSSVKGALRELTERQPNGKVNARLLFGADNPKGGNPDLQQGSITVSDAQLLALPVRASRDFFYVATTPPLLRDLDDALAVVAPAHALRQEITSLLDLPDAGKLPLAFGGSAGALFFEFKEAFRAKDAPELPELRKLLGDRIALLPVTNFQELAKDLPTVARNSLDNGISDNLWYEEYVPRESRFFLEVGSLAGDKPLRTLQTILDEAGHRVQLGANATVGFGLTEWSPVAVTTKTTAA